MLQGVIGCGRDKSAARGHRPASRDEPSPRRPPRQRASFSSAPPRSASNRKSGIRQLWLHEREAVKSTAIVKTSGMNILSVSGMNAVDRAPAKARNKGAGRLPRQARPKASFLPNSCGRLLRRHFCFHVCVRERPHRVTFECDGPLELAKSEHQRQSDGEYDAAGRDANKK
jgi:hypothetical protein